MNLEKYLKETTVTADIANPDIPLDTKPIKKKKKLKKNKKLRRYLDGE